MQGAHLRAPVPTPSAAFRPFPRQPRRECHLRNQSCETCLTRWRRLRCPARRERAGRQHRPPVRLPPRPRSAPHSARNHFSSLAVLCKPKLFSCYATERKDYERGACFPHYLSSLCLSFVSFSTWGSIGFSVSRLASTLLMNSKNETMLAAQQRECARTHGVGVHRTSVRSRRELAAHTVRSIAIIRPRIVQRASS